MDSALAQFCALNEKARADRLAHKAERDDARRSKNATKELLISSLERSKAAAVALPDETYARLSSTAIRYTALRSEDDVLALFDDLQSQLQIHSANPFAKTTHELFLKKARIGGGEKSITIVKRVPKDEAIARGAEPVRLAASFAASCAHARDLSAKSKPLRDALRTATKELAPQISALPSAPRVVARDQTGAERGVLSVSVATPSSKPPNIGARRVGELVKASALMAEGAALDPRDYERVFRQHLRAMLRTSFEELKRANEARARAPRLLVKREK